jgi:YesN/AraC family two-component response regulator
MTSIAEDKFLEPWELEAVLYIERIHSSTGALPGDDDILEYLRFTKKFTGINAVSIDNLKNSELFKASMDARGITEIGLITQRQMAAASVMLNLTDRRSDEKKLRDIGVSTEEYSNWVQDNTFAEYLRQRSEQLITNSVHEAHMGLMRGVRQGNTASIKLYYELSGRYNPNEENNVNVRLLIGKVLEAIQKHVREPATLNKLAVELSQLAIEAGSPVANRSVIGETVKRELS